MSSAYVDCDKLGFKVMPTYMISQYQAGFAKTQ